MLGVSATSRLTTHSPSPECGAIDAAIDEAVPLRGTGLSRTFHQGENEIPALRDVDIEIGRAEFVAIIGSSGSGKSTLMHLLGALDRPDGGQVLLEGRDIADLPERELAVIRRRRLGFLLQFFSLFPTMTACENVAFPLKLDGLRDAFARAREALESVGLDHRLHHRPREMSGGEQQRAALARALVVEPAVLLADEPTGSLDSDNSDMILNLLRDIADRGQAVVVVTHEASIGLYADRMLRLNDGKLADATGADERVCYRDDRPTDHRRPRTGQMQL